MALAAPAGGALAPYVPYGPLAAGIARNWYAPGNKYFRKGLRRVGRWLRTGKFKKGAVSRRRRGTLSRNYKSKPIKGKNTRMSKYRKKGRGKVSLRRKVNKLSRRCAQVSRAAQTTTAQKTRRIINPSHVVAGSNTQNVVWYVANDLNTIANAMTVQVNEPPGSATFVSQNLDVAGATFSRKILIKSILQKLTLQNSSTNNAHIKVYCMMPRDETNDNPQTSWAAGIANIPGGAGPITINSIFQYPSDYHQVRHTWKSKVILDTILVPGQKAVCSKMVKSVQYDPSIYDTESDQYQSSLKCFGFLLVCSGDISRQAAATQVGKGDVAIDVIQEVKYVIEYPGGANFKYIEIANNLNVLTAPVQAMKPRTNIEPFTT